MESIDKTLGRNENTSHQDTSTKNELINLILSNKRNERKITSSSSFIAKIKHVLSLQPPFLANNYLQSKRPKVSFSSKAKKGILATD